MCRVDPSSPVPKYRSVKRVLPRPANKKWVSDGFHVYPVFADMAFTEDISPLLMFDYAAPKRFSASKGKPRGVGQHPHRGFETVTIAFQGGIEHHDSTGRSGVIQPGDCQWMTAGRGIIHEEYHSKEFTHEGGVFEMCQLWVNLPRQHKMTQPDYQGIMNKDIPVVNLPEGCKARIIAGNLHRITGAAKTFSPVQLWDVSLPIAGSDAEFPFDPDHNCIVFVRRGSVEIIEDAAAAVVVDDDYDDDDDDNLQRQASRLLGPQDLAVLSRDGCSNLLKIRVVEPESSIMIMGGEPLNEPIAHHGPFVMNTQRELKQAIRDFHDGKMGV